MAKNGKRTQNSEIAGKSRKSSRKTPTKATTLKIGEVSRKSGIPVVTLRYYEKERLIAAFQNAETKISTHRRFALPVLVHLDFIKLCRASGFSIPEIRSLMRLYRGFKIPSKSRMAALKRSIDLVREQKARLTKIEKVLLYRFRNPEGDIEDVFDVETDPY